MDWPLCIDTSSHVSIDDIVIYIERTKEDKGTELLLLAEKRKYTTMYICKQLLSQ